MYTKIAGWLPGSGNKLDTVLPEIDFTIYTLEVLLHAGAFAV
jgi:hypothetical protein